MPEHGCLRGRHLFAASWVFAGGSSNVSDAGQREAQLQRRGRNDPTFVPAGTPRRTRPPGCKPIRARFELGDEKSFRARRVQAAAIDALEGSGLKCAPLLSIASMTTASL